VTDSGATFTVEAEPARYTSRVKVLSCLVSVALTVGASVACNDSAGEGHDPGSRDSGVDAANPDDGSAGDSGGDAAFLVDGGAICGDPEIQLRPNQFDQLAGCAVYRGPIHISDTRNTSFPELANLRAVEGRLSFFRNDQLITLTGVENIETLGGLSATNHARLTDLRGFVKLHAIHGDVLIGSNFALTSLHGLEGVRTTGPLQISSNQALPNLDALAALEVIDGDLIIRDNPLLPQAAAQAFAARVQVSGSVEITANGG